MDGGERGRGEDGEKRRGRDERKRDGEGSEKKGWRTGREERRGGG